MKARLSRWETVPTGRKHSRSPHMITSYQMEPIRLTYSLYRENDTEKATPVYETSTQMTVSGFRGAIPDITQWIGHSGNMQMVVALEPSDGGTGKTMEGRVVLNKGTDETISVTLGQTAYQKTMDLTIHDGRLKNDKNYTLTVQLGKKQAKAALHRM